MHSRLSSGDYIVCDDTTGRRIGSVKREQIPTARSGYVHFVAYVGNHRKNDVFAGVHDLLKSAVAAVEGSAGRETLKKW